MAKQSISAKIVKGWINDMVYGRNEELD